MASMPMIILPSGTTPTLITLHLPPHWYPQELFAATRPHTYVHCVSLSQHRSCPRCSYLLHPLKMASRSPGSTPCMRNEILLWHLDAFALRKGFTWLWTPQHWPVSPSCLPEKYSAMKVIALILPSRYCRGWVASGDSLERSDSNANAGYYQPPNAWLSPARPRRRVRWSPWKRWPAAPRSSLFPPGHWRSLSSMVKLASS